MAEGAPVVVVGAGPAGLTAAYQLVKAGVPTLVAERDDVVGGLSRTVVRDGWRIDLGGHRFFTKIPAVERVWEEILMPEEFPRRRRTSRILYRGHLFDYPLEPANVLANLGLVGASRALVSYLAARLRPPADQSTYEGWLVARFGRHLYRTFFATYTEKVWGAPASAMPADWAAQRVRDLDLGRAVLGALVPRWARRGPVPVSLVGEFRYPRLGAGMMWERCRDAVVAAGATVELGTSVAGVHLEGGRVAGCTLESLDGSRRTVAASHVVSSMPLGELVAALDPPPPEPVRAAAASLTHRDFLVVALVVPARVGFADQWIYVHTPGVAVGRVQNYGSWSPDMVRPGTTCLGLEYFVSEGDRLWSAADEDLVALAARELGSLGLVEDGEVRDGWVVRVPRAYPFYDRCHRANIATVARHLAEAAPNLHPVGRNGMHRYNNQDHSMLTAMLAVENVLGARHDLWAVNVDGDYHEAVAGTTTATTATTPSSGA